MVCVHAPGGCYGQMLVIVTRWPLVTSQYTDNELDHLCCVWLSQAILKPLFILSRFMERSYSFSGKAKIHTHKVSWLHTWTLSIVTAGHLASEKLHWSDCGFFKDTKSSYSVLNLLKVLFNQSQSFHTYHSPVATETENNTLWFTKQPSKIKELPTNS